MVLNKEPEKREAYWGESLTMGFEDESDWWQPGERLTVISLDTLAQNNLKY